MKLMQTAVSATSATSSSTSLDKGVWGGRAVSALVVLFMVFDGVAKLVHESHVLQASAQLGWPESQTTGLGLLVLACTAVYAVPRTSVLGAVLLTGFLGGATAAKVRIEDASLFFSVAMGVLTWGGLWLRDARVRALLPLRK
jgi:hypothetical protein